MSIDTAALLGLVLLVLGFGDRTVTLIAGAALLILGLIHIL